MANPLTNRKFIHFNHLENFESLIEDNPGSILDSQIVFIKDARKIWTHGTYYTLDERITEDIYAKLEALAGISADIIQKLDEVQFISAGPTADRPVAAQGETLEEGICYLDTDLGKPIWWDGTYWIDADGNRADLPHSGTTLQRPAIADVKIGFDYFDTTTGNLYVSDGTQWVRITDTTLSWASLDNSGNISNLERIAADSEAWNEIN